MSKNSFSKANAICALAACVGGCGAQPPTADVETQTSSIINGTTVSASEAQYAGLVAIYHPYMGYTFFPRPCSGVIVSSWARPASSVGVLSYVFTARHCATVDGEPNSALVTDGRKLQLLAGATPGLANPNLPAGTVPALPPIDLGAEGDDSVLIPVIADWSGIANTRPSLYVGKVAELVNQPITAYGYGMTGNDAGCQGNANTTGAGTARSGQFTVSSPATWADGESFAYRPSSTAGAVLTCGDSGGPDEFFPNAFYPSHTISGVHSEPTLSIAINMQVQRALGGLYLSPMANQSYDLGVDASNAIIFYQRGDLRRGAIMYDAATQRLTLNGLCLSWSISTINGVPTFAPVPQPCDPSNGAQKWDIGPSLQIRNVMINLCWSSTGPGNLTLATCGTPSAFALAPAQQQWVMSGQP